MVTYTFEQANARVMRRHALDARRPRGQLLSLVDDIVALHATSPTTPYLSLLARLEGFKRSDLEREMSGRGNLGKLRCMRRTVHVLTREMLPVAFQATFRRTRGRRIRALRHIGTTQARYRRVANRVLKAVGEDGLTAREAREAVGDLDNLSMLLSLMCDEGLLVRGPPRSGWRSNAHTYHAWETLLPEVDLESVDGDEAEIRLARAYMGAFGPALDEDLRWWAGWTKTQTRKALAALGDEVSEVEVEGRGMLMLREDEATLEEDVDAGRVSLLPLQDPYLMGYKKRSRYLDLNRRYYVFDKSGNVTSTILLDGRIVGVWDLLDEGPVMVVHVFEGLPKDAMESVREEAASLAGFLAEEEVEVVEVERMTPLFDRTAGGFMHPLAEPGR